MGKTFWSIVGGVLAVGLCLVVGLSAFWLGGHVFVTIEKEIPGSQPAPAEAQPTQVLVQPTAAAAPAIQPTSTPVVANPGSSDLTEVFRAGGSLDYPNPVGPDASRQPVFPDVAYGSRPALVAYEEPFEDGDFCDSTPCNMDVPQYYYRVMTAGQVTIPDLGVNCVASETKGCLVIVINHFGPTAMWRGNTIDHGFTIAGRVWDMGSPDKVTLAAQALLDHYVLRMTGSEDGANCGVIDACPTVEWHVVVVGNGEGQVHWTGLFRR
jgi:hypothetical protein